MSGEPITTIIGNLVDDPELRYTPDGKAVTNFRIASTARVYDRDTNEWTDGNTLFITCNVWNDYAENVAESFTRGDRIMAHGRFRQREYEHNDEKRVTYELQADEVGAVLRFATVEISKQKKYKVENSEDSDPWSGERTTRKPTKRTKAKR